MTAAGRWAAFTLTFLSNDGVLLVVRVVCVSQQSIGSEFKLQELVSELALVTDAERRAGTQQQRAAKANEQEKLRQTNEPAVKAMPPGRDCLRPLLRSPIALVHWIRSRRSRRLWLSSLAAVSGLEWAERAARLSLSLARARLVFSTD